MTKQEIIDALTALAAALDAIKGSSTDEEFHDAYKDSDTGIGPINWGVRDLRRG